MSSIDSEVVFVDRMKELNLESLIQPMAALGYNTYGSFSFAVSWHSDKADAQFMEKVVLPLIGEKDPREPRLKRLHFESYTMVASDLKRQVEAGDDTPARRLNPLERERRRAIVAQTRTTKKLQEWEEPGDGLVDSCIQMFEEKMLVYLPPSWCPSKSEEMKARKPGKAWKPPVGAELLSDTSTTLNLERAWIRRGIAMTQGGLLSEEAHKRVILRLMNALTEEPVDSRYGKISMEQVLNADQWIWKRMQQKCPIGFRAVGGVLPLDSALAEILLEPRLEVLLLPLPKAAGQGQKRPQEQAGDGQEPPSKRALRRQKARERQKNGGQAPAAPAAPKQPAVQHPQPPPAPRIGERAGGGPRMPKALLGSYSKTPDGRNLCYGFGHGTCNKAEPGRACDKGLHVCGFCFKPDHATINHHH